MDSAILPHNTRKEYLLAGGLFLVFATIYSLISLVNHYCFRTAALDLGINNHTLYHLSHFKGAHFTLDLAASNTNFFGDHFSPIVLLYIPFYYLFGSYTVLFIQIGSILFGGWGVYKYTKRKFPEGSIPLIITFQFLSIWGIYSALSFDFHNNVVGAMFVPWLLYFYERSQKSLFILCFIIILVSKENMALWLSFIMSGLMLKNGLRNYKKHIRFELPLCIFALVYFIIVVSFVMPELQNLHNNYQLSRYATLGNSLPEIIVTVIKHPLHFIRLLMKEPDGHPGIKIELLLVVVASGGLALLYRPYYFLMLLPIFLQKLLTNDPSICGVDAQYSIELAPILSLALVDSIAKIRFVKIRLWISTCFAVTSFMATIYLLDHMEISANGRFYAARHYTSGLNTPEIYRALKLIPGNASVSASSNLSPHLADREKIYAFPNIKDAQYLALFDASVRSTYPLDTTTYNKLLNKYKDSAAFIKIYNQNKLLILKRK